MAREEKQTKYLIDAMYIYVTLVNQFFVALSVRRLSYCHFKPSFSSLGQTSSDSINFTFDRKLRKFDKKLLNITKSLHSWVQTEP